MQFQHCFKLVVGVRPHIVGVLLASAQARQNEEAKRQEEPMKQYTIAISVADC